MLFGLNESDRKKKKSDGLSYFCSLSAGDPEVNADAFNHAMGTDGGEGMAEDVENKIDFTKKTPQGYDVEKIVHDKSGRKYAVIYRPTVKDYVFAAGYDTSDGTWSQGYYGFNSFADAYVKLRKHIKYMEENLSEDFVKGQTYTNRKGTTVTVIDVKDSDVTYKFPSGLSHCGTKDSFKSMLSANEYKLDESTSSPKFRFTELTQDGYETHVANSIEELKDIMKTIVADDIVSATGISLSELRAMCESCQKDSITEGSDDSKLYDEGNFIDYDELVSNMFGNMSEVELDRQTRNIKKYARLVKLKALTRVCIYMNASELAPSKFFDDSIKASDVARFFDDFATGSVDVVEENINGSTWLYFNSRDRAIEYFNSIADKVLG